jgi:hypothetical protein
VIGAIGFILCTIGTACIYYGTEQGFFGHGGDNQIREAMFNKAGQSLLNTSCRIYQKIAKIAAVTQNNEPLRFGRLYYRQISSDGQNFGLPFGTSYTLAFSRMLYGQEILVACNVSGQAHSDSIVIDATLHPDGSEWRSSMVGAVTRK